MAKIDGLGGFWKSSSSNGIKRRRDRYGSFAMAYANDKPSWHATAVPALQASGDIYLLSRMEDAVTGIAKRWRRTGVGGAAGGVTRHRRGVLA